VSSITGIELGPDSCVLARVRSLAAAAEVSALHVIEPSTWPMVEAGVAETLREVRKRKGFARRAVVALWGLSEPATPDAPHVRPLLRPMIAAGFKIARVLTVPEALAALSRTRPRAHGDAVAWLVLNTHGAAIAIVRDGTLLYSRTIDWTYSSGPAGARAQMLQRYSLVSHLAPEVRRGMVVARNQYGAIVEVAVTCGNLPDLRSLTMPLIEELDIEVETLDSTEGLLSTGSARTDRFAESAPSLRLAVASAVAASPARRSLASRPIVRATAAAAIVAVALWAGSRQLGGSRVRSAGTRVAAGTASPALRTAAPPATPPAAKPSPVTAQSPAPTPAKPAPQQTAPPAQTPPPQTAPAPQQKPPQQTAKPLVPPPQTAPPPKAATSTPPPNVATSTPPPKAATSTPTPPREAPKSAPETSVKPPPPQQKPPVRVPAAAPVQTAPPQQTAPPPSPPPARLPPPPAPEPPREPEVRLEPVVTRATPPARRQIPLKDPVPPVDSILIARNRRVAVIGGSIVGIGDSVGARVVVQIERNAVVLREPSGYELRVALRGTGAD
jgi:hypothetical protein